MRIHRFVGVQIQDEDLYQSYREHMTPILESYGGFFAVDVRVSEVLRAPEDASFDRLFTISFPNEEAMRTFFSDPAYLKVRQTYFEPGVSEVHSLATFHVP